jgi:asparaginyl-tRNA synthetase
MQNYREHRPPKSWKDLDDHHLTAISSDWYRNIASIQSTIVAATVNFYNSLGYHFVLLPITTGSVSSPIGLGSDSRPVSVTIDGIDTHLADSMQFLLEYACRLTGGGCYYLAPSFRLEKADNRHLCQFYHSEVEIEGSLENAISLSEKYLKHLCKTLLHERRGELISLAGTTEHIRKFIKTKRIPLCTFDEASKICTRKDEILYHSEGYRTITPKGEKKLINHFDGIVWITHFDHISVPFYQKSVDDNFTVAKNADLLMGIGEVVGLGERHPDGTDTLRALRYHNIPKEKYEWYIEMKDKVPLQTSGFGMGVERFLLWLLKTDDIRDMQIIPRFNGHEHPV